MFQYFTLSFFLFLPLVSHASAQINQGKVTQGNDYSNCEPKMYYTNPLYQLTETGALQIDSKNPDVVAFKRSENQDEVKIRSPWMGSKKYIETVIFKRANGKPESISILQDPKLQEEYKQSAYGAYPGFEAPMGTKTTFAYNGNKCFVKEVSSIFEKKEVVNYDHQICTELLEIAKKATAKKLQECKMAFAKMGEILKTHKDKFEENGKELSMGFGYGIPQKSDTKATFFDQDWNMMGTIGSCNATRAMYGLPLDPDTDTFGGGAFVGPFASPMGDAKSGNGDKNSGTPFGGVQAK